MTAIIGAAKSKEDIVPFVIRNVTKELVKAYPQIEVAEAFYDTLANAVALAGTSYWWVSHTIKTRKKGNGSILA